MSADLPPSHPLHRTTSSPAPPNRHHRSSSIQKPDKPSLPAIFQLPPLKGQLRPAPPTSRLTAAASSAVLATVTPPPYDSAANSAYSLTHFPSDIAPAQPSPPLPRSATSLAVSASPPLRSADPVDGDNTWPPPGSRGPSPAPARADRPPLIHGRRSPAPPLAASPDVPPSAGTGQASLTADPLRAGKQLTPIVIPSSGLPPLRNRGGLIPLSARAPSPPALASAGDMWLQAPVGPAPSTTAAPGQAALSRSTSPRPLPIESTQHTGPSPSLASAVQLPQHTRAGASGRNRGAVLPTATIAGMLALSPLSGIASGSEGSSAPSPVPPLTAFGTQPQGPPAFIHRRMHSLGSALPGAASVPPQPPPVLSGAAAAVRLSADTSSTADRPRATQQPQPSLPQAPQYSPSFPVQCGGAAESPALPSGVLLPPLARGGLLRSRSFSSGARPVPSPSASSSAPAAASLVPSEAGSHPPVRLPSPPASSPAAFSAFSSGSGCKDASGSPRALPQLRPTAAAPKGVLTSSSAFVPSLSATMDTPGSAGISAARIVRAGAAALAELTTPPAPTVTVCNASTGTLELVTAASTNVYASDSDTTPAVAPGSAKAQPPVAGKPPLSGGDGEVGGVASLVGVLSSGRPRRRVPVRSHSVGPTSGHADGDVPTDNGDNDSAPATGNSSCAARGSESAAVQHSGYRSASCYISEDEDCAAASGGATGGGQLTRQQLLFRRKSAAAAPTRRSSSIGRSVSPAPAATRASDRKPTSSELPNPLASTLAGGDTGTAGRRPQAPATPPPGPPVSAAARTTPQPSSPRAGALTPSSLNLSFGTPSPKGAPPTRRLRAAAAAVRGSDSDDEADWSGSAETSVVVTVPLTGRSTLSAVAPADAAAGWPHGVPLAHSLDDDEEPAVVCRNPDYLASLTGAGASLLAVAAGVTPLTAAPAATKAGANNCASAGACDNLKEESKSQGSTGAVAGGGDGSKLNQSVCCVVG